MAIKLTNDYLLSTQLLLRLVLLTGKILPYNLGFGVFVGAVDSRNDVFILEVRRPTNSVTALLCGFLLALNAEFTYFVVVAVGLEMVIGRTQASIK
jgi:hypothetical protein